MLPMSTPMLIVAVILQVTGIWNDFILGLTFAGRENLPMTVQLNNIVNSTQGERAYNVDMAATVLTALVAARRLLRLRALVRARHRRRRREGLSHEHRLRPRRQRGLRARARVRRPLDSTSSRASSWSCSAPRAAASPRCSTPSPACSRSTPARSGSASATSPGRSPRTAASPWCSSPTRSTRA